MARAPKVLQVAAIDLTVKALLLPLVRRLQTEGLEVHIACSDGPYASEMVSQGYKIHPLTISRRISPLSNLRSLALLVALMKRERYDVVHVHTPVAAALGRVAAWLARVPVVVYTAHGFYFHDRMPEYKRRPTIWLERLLGHTTTVVFTQSGEDAATAATERICPKGRIIHIGNGVDTSRFQPASQTNRSALGLNDADKVVGFIGRFVREKGILDLVDAADLACKAIPDFKLLLVGDTLGSDRDNGIKAELQRRVNKNGLASRVIFSGFMEDIPRVLSAIDVLVLPSYREGMPRVVIETMASGKPVIATDIRGCREEVVHGATGLLVPPGDVASLAHAMVKILSDHPTASRMGQAGRRRALETFDEGRVLQRQVDIYSQLVSGHQKGGKVERPAWQKVP